MSMNMKLHPRREQGTVMVIVLLVLAAATLLSVRSATQGLLQTKMAQAYETGISALQTSESAIDYVIADFTNYVNQLGTADEISITTIGTNPAINLEAGDTLDLTLGKQQIAGQDCVPAPRLRAEKSSSVVAYGRFDFVVESELDRTANQNGRSHIWRGYTLLAPLPPGETC